MYVRQQVGRQAGAIIEMPYEAATANLANGTVSAVSEQEIAEAGLPPVGGLMAAPPDALLADFKIEPDGFGGFNLYDAGGVPLNEALNGGKPFHNHAAARSAAMDHARASRGLPEQSTGTEKPQRAVKVSEPAWQSKPAASPPSAVKAPVAPSPAIKASDAPSAQDTAAIGKNPVTGR